MIRSIVIMSGVAVGAALGALVFSARGAGFLREVTSK